MKIKIVAGGCIHQHSILDKHIPNGDLFVLTGDFDAKHPMDREGRLRVIDNLVDDLDIISSQFDRLLVVDGNHGTHTDPSHPINQDEHKGDHYLHPWEMSQAIINSHGPDNLYWDLTKRFEMIEYKGLRILKTPLSPEIKDRGNDWKDPWGWHIKSADVEGMKALIKIWGGVDIVIAHGPPHGYGDRIWPKHAWRGDNGQHTGCHYYNELIEEWKPKLFINSHIHEDINNGEPIIHSNGITHIHNVSMTNDQGELVNDFRIIELEY